MELVTYTETVKGYIVKRPSKRIKSPYVADVLVDGEEKLAHCPSLGLGGIIQPGVEVLMTKSTTKSKTDFVIQAVYSEGDMVGNVPLHANQIVKKLLKANMIEKDVTTVKSEVKHGESRYDFVITKEQEEIYCEVKSVHIQDESDPQTAIFPVGYKKPKHQTVSDRANKHVEGLTSICKTGGSAVIVFVIQRNDCTNFQPNRKGDPVFSELLDTAVSNGVRVYTVYTKVEENGIFLRDVTRWN